MNILVVEALLTIYLSKRRANTYRHRKYDRRIVGSSYLFHHSVGPAKLNCTIVRVHECTNLPIATETRPLRNKRHVTEEHFDHHSARIFRLMPWMFEGILTGAYNVPTN